MKIGEFYLDFGIIMNVAHPYMDHFKLSSWRESLSYSECFIYP